MGLVGRIFDDDITAFTGPLAFKSCREFRSSNTDSIGDRREGSLGEGDLGRRADRRRNGGASSDDVGSRIRSS